jgi:hypothetical protein
MAKIFLRCGEKKEDKKEFDLEHAQAILDLNRINRTNTWFLDDPKHKLDENGKIISIADSGASKEA